MAGDLRLRVFAGPNGSGKSTIINNVRNTQVGDATLDFGIYINADDIAVKLRGGSLSLKDYNIKGNFENFIAVALASGLIGERFLKEEFLASFRVDAGTITLMDSSKVEHLSQILADYFRKQLLFERKKFSFETVFSHESKVEVMRQAALDGYKVYLYFVCTENPDINVYRVKEVRVKHGGHDVPENRIRDRYYRSLEFLHEAAQWCHRVYFFDNSEETYKLFADFKVVNSKKKWSKINEDEVPEWFKVYYSNKNE